MQATKDTFKMMAALACGALALVACSGNQATRKGIGTPDEQAPSTGTPPGQMPDTGPDDRTEDQKAFDRELGNARTRLSNAKSSVTSAASRASAAATEAERTEARTELDEARRELSRTVDAVRQLQAPENDAARAKQATQLLATAEAEQLASLVALRTAENAIVWSSQPLGEVNYPSSTVGAVRNLRQNAFGDDSSTLLKASDIPAVMYAAGKVVLGSGSGSSGDRLRMRGIPLVYVDLNGGMKYGNRLAIKSADNQPNLVAGLQVTSSGLVVDIGGKNADGRDFRLDGALETEIARTGTVNGYDLTLSFGRPAASPNQNPEWYWRKALMPGSDNAGTAALGSYIVRLSNHAGVDLGLEDPNDPEGSAEDDVHAYLSYAAYGFMDFLGPNRFSGNTESNFDRVFPFHVGYDAFADKSGMRVTDVSDSDRILSGSFKGRTIAAQVDEAYTYDQVFLPSERYGARLRGDIELTATISGTGSSNKISGTIKNLEYWGMNGQWEDFRPISGRVTLGEANIADSGSFRGGIAAPASNFGTGKYQGNFYGPLSGLEAAGTWFVESGGTLDNDYFGIVGSFGAKHVPDSD